MKKIKNIILDETICDINEKGAIGLKNPITRKCNIIIPEKINNISVKTIERHAFKDCVNIQAIELPQGLVSINDSAFENCQNLRKIVFSDSVNYIGTNAFYKCENLEEITMPSSISDIKIFAFNNTKWLKNRQEENPLVIINDILINATAATGDIMIPENVKKIADGAFNNSHITSVSVPKSISEIPIKCFSDCSKLKSIFLPDTIKSIDSLAFESCSKLKTINLPNSIENIDNAAFYYCSSLESITIPNKITKLSQSLFLHCTNLKEITIPNSVKTVETNALAYCKNLSIINGMNNIKTIEYNSFQHCNSLSKIPKFERLENVGMWAFYGTNWLSKRKQKKDYITINNILINTGKLNGDIIIPNNISIVAPDCFLNNNKIVSVEFGAGLEEIKLFPFCYGLNIETLILSKECKKIHINTNMCSINLKHVLYKGTEEQLNTLLSKKGEAYFRRNNIKLLSIKTITDYISGNNVSSHTFNCFINDNPSIRKYALKEIDKSISNSTDLNEKLRLLSARDEINQQLLYNDTVIKTEYER